MHLQFVTIGENLKWPRGRLSLARKKTSQGNYDPGLISSSKNFQIYFAAEKHQSMKPIQHVMSLATNLFFRYMS